MDLTPVSATVPVNPSPASQIAQATQTDQVKQAKIAETQSAKLSFVYFSPVIKIDRATSTAIFQYRDGESGEVTREIPTGKEIKAYSKDAVKPVERDEAEVAETDDGAAEEEQHVEVDA